MTYTAPQPDAGAYTCPHCGAFAQFIVCELYRGRSIGAAGMPPSPWSTTICAACQGEIAWHRGALRWPTGTVGPLPQDAMPAAVKELYLEARDVAARSPRSAAALLRLALQHLLQELTAPGMNINDSIKRLVAEGLPTPVQQAMDVLRVVGNNAVHPGEVSLEDNREALPALFGLLNVVVEDRIVRPAAIGALYKALPEGAREAIERRDGGAVTIS